MSQIEQAASEIAAFMQRLYIQKLTTTSGGNLSIRVGERVFISPSGIDKGNLKPEDIGIMDMDGNIIGKPFKPSIESGMHLSIYKARPNINAIVHAHPVNACTFAATDLKINTRLGSEAYAILGQIAYAGYALMGTNSLAEEVAKFAADSNCVMMRNHGVLTVGKTMLEAFDRLEVLENTAIITMNTMKFPQEHLIELTQDELADIDHLMGRS